jgi:hypothetical protein
MMNVPNKELWIAGSGSTPGKLMAKSGSAFYPVNSILINIKQDGCKVTGYSDGVNLSSGRATIEMEKAYYMANPALYPSLSVGSRHGIKASEDGIVLRGLIIKNTGGDGVYLGGGTGTTVTDVTTDGAYRNGLTVISSDSLTVTNCAFNNTSGTSPEAGVDFEPNSDSNRLTNIVFNNCSASNNTGHNMQFGMKNHHGPNIGTIDISFYDTTITGGTLAGIKFSQMWPDGPTGSIYFQDTVISNTPQQGLLMQAWGAGRARLIFNDGSISNCGNGNSGYTPISIGDAGLGTFATVPIGDIYFQGNWRVDDYVSHARVIGGGCQAGFKRISGAVSVQRHFTPAPNPLVQWISSVAPINVTLTATSIPWP